MATAIVSKQLFTHWARSTDDGDLDLWLEKDGAVLEKVSLDVTELLDRSDLLDRLSPAARARLVWEAREVAKGNRTLSPAFPGYDATPVEHAA